MTTRKSIRPLHPDLGAEVRGIDLAVSLVDDDLATIESAFAEHSLLVFPDQHVTPESLFDFAVRFGEPDTSLLGARQKTFDVRGTSGAANLLSNLDPDGDPYTEADARALELKTVMQWHTDSSYKTVPSKASFLAARQIPGSGGETCFASTRAAYEQLNEATRARLDGLSAIHDYRKHFLDAGCDYPPGALDTYPLVVHPLVRTHQPTGRKALYLGSHAASVIGLDPEEGRMLLNDLLAHTTRPDHVYCHHWRADDVIMWDNRCVVHRVMPYPAEPRVMYRASVRDDYAGKVA